VKRILAAGLSAALVAFGLSACGEKPQVAGSPAQDGVAGNTVQTDSKPWSGEPLPFQAGNFSRGDEASWDKALARRAQGQNEYIRIGGGAR
jgi:hypothetical protein